jgi:hypothetical protein
MTTRRKLPLVALTVLLTASLALPAWADEDRPRQNRPTILVLGDDGDEIVIDMADVNEIVNEAMEGFGEAMAELEDMQLQIRLGQDNRLDLSYDDTTFELDIDQIMTQVAGVLEVGLSEFDAGKWTRSSHRWRDVADEDLEAELNELRSEMRELRAELKKLRDRKSR